MVTVSLISLTLGMSGDMISKFIKEKINSYFVDKNNYDISVFSAESVYKAITGDGYIFIRKCFEIANASLKETSIDDIKLSGTTCIILITINGRLISANVGDTRAILIKSDDIVIPLSNDHKPTVPEEQERIIQSGGAIYRLPDEEGSPHRVWLKDKSYPGLAMSRSIGDYIAKDVGVTCDPEIMEFVIDKTFQYIVLATDGVWEFVSNQTARDLVRPFYDKDDIYGGCKKVVKESAAQWKKYDVFIDDITVIVVYFRVVSL
jgi:serine/threonine protein phosphatase PrpC